MSTAVKINEKVNLTVILPAFKAEIEKFLAIEQILDYSFVTNDIENQNTEILNCNQYK